MATVPNERAILIALNSEIGRIHAKAEEAMTAIVAALEAWAKDEHSYKDQSGDLSGSITGFVGEITPLLIRGHLGAGMPYGYFLEVLREGKWAFLEPTVRNHYDDIVAIAERAFRS